MRITRIDLEGQLGAYATLERRMGSQFIEVEILTPGIEKKHFVNADDRHDQMSMAQCLQETLNGVRGSQSAINEYYLEIKRLGDC